MTSPRQHARLLHLATCASLTVAITLVVAKAVAWAMSGSVSLLAGLTDSLMDSAASLLNLLAVRYSLKPADDDHRYGHGKAEALAGLAQALFIGVSAVLVATQAYARLRDPQPLGAETLGIAVMVVSLLLTAGLLLFQRWVIRATGSTAIRADSLHYRSDLLLNSGILLALLLASFGWQQADGIFGLGIAGYILWSAFSIARESVSVLMDEELSPEITADMHRLACEVPGVLGAHDLRTRISGSHWYVQLNLELPGDLPLSRAHALCHQAADAITAQYPRAEVLVHADPGEVAKRD